MFSLHQYVSFNNFDSDYKCTVTPTKPTKHSLILFWCPIMFPSIPLEKLFPFVISTMSSDSIHKNVTRSRNYKHFVSVYRKIVEVVVHHIILVNKLPPSICLNSFCDVISSFHQKTQRIVSFNMVKLKTALLHLQKNDLFVYASQLECFSENKEVQILIFTNLLRVQILFSIQSFIEQSSFTKEDFLILPYSTKPKQRQNLLVLKEDMVSTIQHYIFCEWASDSSSVRRNSLLLSPFIATNFDRNDLTIFSTIKTLLRWFCVSRSQYRGLLQPGQPGFIMYKDLPLMVSCFSVRRELSKYHTRKLVSTSSKRIDNNTPNFLRGLKSFLQLKNEHFIDFNSIKHIHHYIHSRKYLQSVFPQVWDITNHIMFTSKRKGKISLNDLFILNGTPIPSYMFLYAMMIHKSVPKKIKQMIWLNTYTTTAMILPSKLKGIEQMQRHTLLYKSYDKYVQYGRTKEPYDDMKEFLQLMACLEYRSYMNPSKISFKVSNIPVIKLKHKPTGFPIVATDKAKTTQEINKKNYVYSSHAWVIRHIDFPSSFSCRRDFMFDELLYYKLLNEI